MECNRDEALRSKTLAETKFFQRDYLGARKFALKAKQLFPELEGLPQFICVLDVHVVAQNKLRSGENNWYDILEVDPSADDSTIRKQYRRLALLLHPDKNKAVGAESAFQHVSEAWTVLSDKNKKAAYDARCQGKMPPPAVRPPQQHSAPNSVRKPTMSTFASPFQRQAQTEQAQSVPPLKPCAQPAFAPSISNSVTFWTSCPSCKMLLEYQRVYLSKNLCCPLCYKAFLATEVASVSGILLWPPPPKQAGHRVNAFSKGFVPPFGADGGFPAPQFGSFPFGNLKARHTAFPSSVLGDDKDTAQKDKLEGFVTSSKLTTEMKQKVEERIMSVQAKLNRPSAVPEKTMQVKQKVTKKHSKEELKAKAAADAREFSNSLMAKLKGVIEQKLSAEKERKLKANIAKPEMASKQKSSPRQTATSSGPNARTKPCEGSQAKEVSANKSEDINSQNSTAVGKRATPMFGDDKHSALLSSKKAKIVTESASISNIATAQAKGDSKQASVFSSVGSQACSQGSPGTDPSRKENWDSTVKAATLVSHSVPVINDNIMVSDAEFYDFDKDRTESHFLQGQIWAAYDDDDGMPRYYARVNKVISSQPFKIQISWLETRSTSDEMLAWLDSGFSVACGEYRVGKAATSNSVNMYSHMLKFEKGLRGGFKIYPQRGDVWALYKNWENLRAKDEKVGYFVVEILADFNKKGVQVCQLEKVDGYKALFQRQTGKELLEWIHTSDLRRFSHQIPAYHLMSNQVPGIREDCWELDPASTPAKLIS